MNEMVLLFTKEQVQNILKGLEKEEARTGVPQTFRVSVPAMPDGVSVEWGQVTFEMKPDEQKEVQPAQTK